jgi:hypothetical protein
MPEARAGARSVTLRAAELALILEGIDLRGTKHRRVWNPQEKRSA